MIKATLVLIGVPVAALLVASAIGYALPRDHAASRVETFAEPADRVFAVLQDVERYPEWRSDVASVELLALSPLRWRERGRNGTLTFEMHEAVPSTRLVTRIADTSLPFGGTWTYLLTSAADGTRLAITENGQVHNPLFRFMARFVFGHTATLDRFLGDLRRRLERR